jgi:hypothetical protein
MAGLDVVVSKTLPIDAIKNNRIHTSENQGTAREKQTHVG